MLVNRVKDYRKGRGLTQEDLAAKTGVSSRLLFQSKKTNSFQDLMLH